MAGDQNHDRRSHGGPDGGHAADPTPAADNSRREVLIGGAAALAGLTGCAVLQPAPPLSAAASALPGAPAPRGRLVDQVALITGGARGIGRAVAVACAREGADIVCMDRAGVVSPEVPYPPATEADLMETVRLVEAQGRRCLPLRGDVRDMSGLREAVAHGIAGFGRIDLLVANAGIFVPVKLAEMTDRQWQDVVDVNLTGVANAMRAVLPHMAARGRGRIVAISSVEGRRGVSFGQQYVAAKWGVIGLVKGAALELGSSGITVNAVCPTAVNTLMFRNPAVQSAMTPEGLPTPPPESAVVMVSEQVHPLRVPWVEPEDVAATVVFLASPDARYISGAAIDVTAGVGATYTA